jgi:hypothetical protein
MNDIIYYSAFLLGGLGLGFFFAAIIVRKQLEKKSIHIIKEAEEKGEVIKKRKNSASKRKILAAKSRA